MTGAAVDFVVPAYGNWRLVEQCVEALRRHSPRARVIVVNDASPEPAPVELEHQEGVVVLEHEFNRGFAAACNTGMKASAGEFIVLVNSDVTISVDVASRVADNFDRQPDAGSLVVPLLSPQGAVDSFGIVVDSTCAGFVRLHGAEVEALHRSDLPPVVGPYGALAIYRRSAIEAVGFFDEGIFMYGEELDLALRLRDAKWDVLETRQPFGVHLGGATAELGSPRQRYLAGFGRGYILRTYGVLKGPKLLRAMVTEAVILARRLLIFRDLQSLRGRIAGFRAGGFSWRRTVPAEGIDNRIGVSQSLAMRGGRYWRDRFGA